MKEKNYLGGTNDKHKPHHTSLINSLHLIAIITIFAVTITIFENNILKYSIISGSCTFNDG